MPVQSNNVKGVATEGVEGAVMTGRAATETVGVNLNKPEVVIDSNKLGALIVGY